VLFAKRERERDEAWRGRRIGQWLGLGLLKWTIGYGLGAGYFRALAWVAVLVALGAAALVSSGVTAIADRGWLASAWASLDWMVPFVDLDERHTTIPREPARRLAPAMALRPVAGRLCPGLVHRRRARRADAGPLRRSLAAPGNRP
jgi:hypothetical protein